MERQTYKVEEVMQILGIGRNLAYELTKQPGFPALKIGGRVIIPKQAFNNWLTDNPNWKQL